MQGQSPSVPTPQPVDPAILKNRVLSLYRKVLDVIVAVLIFVLLLTLLGAVAGLGLDFATATAALRSGVTSHSLAYGVVDAIDRELVIDVLSVFVLIELFRTFTDYLEFHRVRLQVMAEVGIAFILREVFISLYGHEFNWLDTIALAVLLAVLVAARIADVEFPSRRPSRSE